MGSSKTLGNWDLLLPKSIDGGTSLKLAPEALAMLTDGVDLRSGTLPPWYQRD